jgi:hypothetical protein
MKNVLNITSENIIGFISVQGRDYNTHSEEQVHVNVLNVDEELEDLDFLKEIEEFDEFDF